MSKRPRTLDAFFSPAPTKRSKALSTVTSSETETETDNAKDNSAADEEVSTRATYPFALPHLPSELRELLNFVPASEGRIINDQPDLDLLYFQPYIQTDIQRALFDFLRSELFFYRVTYMIKRGPTESQINTPRYTTVFGLDETARFDEQGGIVDAANGKPLPPTTYKCRPRPLPQCLDVLRELTENATGCKFNFCLVNYYANGNDSISYHSDDERFLGIDPAIASFTLGAKRDFLLKHKPTPGKHESETKPMKLPLASGDMILMRGKTQSNWLHSIPKRKGGEAELGRINITLRRAMVKGGTDNYYRYNVGDGPVHKWDSKMREMLPVGAT
ncbi:DNA oxidative demethylase [Fulvia fulva]|uniref:DNA oxidative demethylase n=1 Tax=Passalora fulva TaxID=5499 RepID=A0A9Q8P465_PASFU|nr:DNA oxidative demethylase [Fulvia fulva]KAK4634693.1 DNA oxidative demethylase [Fulvia fulva]KAK4637604.1 DNA oxidative demethylase [Fulvia fulva]UJO12422.1 DNA oxidative demethylase [Fulvia fulva]WPV10207.1 DNA oxidative demethylase [Fulvia fulva]WPV24159.1 DNA oxidative demethylase [Fulvia fulva]